MNISHSRVSSYLSCPYQHYLRYVECLTSNKPSRPLSFGSDFHKLLELRNRPKELAEAKQNITRAYYDLKPQFQEELGEDYIWDLSNIFNDYLDIYKDCPQPHVTEREFRIPMGNYQGETVYFKGFIDELYLYKSKSTGKKTIKIGEHKTFSRKPDQALLVMNTQKCLYAKACEFMYGVMPETVIWDYIKSTPADEPIWLEKSQKFSGAKSNKITPYSWRRACDKRGITDEAIIAEGHKFSCNIPEFFFRYEVDFIPVMVEDIWEGFKFTAQQIVKNGHKNKAKHVSPNCSWCSYQSICYAELTGGDREYTISKEFEHYERKED